MHAAPCALMRRMDLTATPFKRCWKPLCMHLRPCTKNHGHSSSCKTHALFQHLSDLAKPIFVEEVRHRNAHGASHSFDHFIRPDFNIFHGADTLIIICAKPMGQFVSADCWLAAENMMLAASAIGLGSCVIGSAIATLNIHKVKTELGIPDEYSAIAPIVVGVPSGETHSTSRKEPLILSWKQ